MMIIGRHGLDSGSTIHPPTLMIIDIHDLILTGIIITIIFGIIIGYFTIHDTIQAVGVGGILGHIGLRSYHHNNHWNYYWYKPNYFDDRNSLGEKRYDGSIRNRDNRDTQDKNIRDQSQDRTKEREIKKPNRPTPPKIKRDSVIRTPQRPPRDSRIKPEQRPEEKNREGKIRERKRTNTERTVRSPETNQNRTPPSIKQQNNPPNRPQDNRDRNTGRNTKETRSERKRP